MADSKVSALTALAGSAVEQIADVLPIVDTSTTTTKKILVSELSLAMNKQGTLTAATSGTSIDFSVPAWATEIKVMLNGVSVSAGSPFLVQLGDSGGIENTGYSSTGFSGSTGFGSSAGFIQQLTNSGVANYEGVVILSLMDAATFLWTALGIVGQNVSTGTKATTSAVTTVRLTTVAGTATFDAGSVNISYR